MSERFILVKPEAMPPIRIVRTIQRGEPGSGSGSTDISITRDPTFFTVVSSSGTNGIVQGATTALAGAMTAQDKTELNAATAHVGINPGNPHGTTAADVGADPLGAAAAVQANLDASDAVQAAHIADTGIHYSDAPSDGNKYGRVDGGWSQISEGPAGVAGLIGLGLWEYNVAVGPPPGVGEFRFNDNVITSATELYVSDTSSAGTPTGAFWELLEAGDVIVATDTTNNLNRILLRVIARIDEVGYTTFTLDGGAIIVEGTATSGLDFSLDVIAFGAQGGGGTIPEAPSDGGYYARRNLGWTDIKDTGVDHAARTDNPHQVNAVQVGADPAGTAQGLLDDHVAEADPHPQYVTADEIPGVTTSWPTDTTSPVDGAFLEYVTTEPANPEGTVVTPSIPASPTLLAQWLRDDAFGIDFPFSESNIVAQLDLERTAGTAGVNLYGEVWKRLSGGGDQLMATSQMVTWDVTDRRTVQLNFYIAADVVNIGDRIEFRFYGERYGGGSNPTLTIYTEGTNVSRFISQTSTAGVPAKHASTHESGGSDPISHQQISGAGSNDHAAIDAHIASTRNPHDVMFGQLSDAPTELTPTPHTLAGDRHSDVSGTPALRDLLGFTGSQWEMQRRMNYLGLWANTEYYEGDVVLDGEWTMVANKTTTERPAPQPIGEPVFLYPGTIGENSVSAKQVLFGMRYTAGQAQYLTGYRVYTKIGNVYSLTLVTDPEGTPVYTQLATFTAATDGWVEFNINAALVGVGTKFDLVAAVQEPDPTPTTFNGNWNYQTPNNAGTPASGTINHANNSQDSFRIHKTDSDANDRSADLATLEVGDIIEGVSGLRWAIQSIIDNGTWYNFGVSPVQQELSDGVQNFVFETVVATPITYGEDLDYWNGQPNALGLFIVDDSYDNIVPDDSQYGVDVRVQSVSVSEDWEVVARSGGGGSSGGGGGGDGIPEAPNDGNAYVRKSEAWADLASEPVSGVLYETHVIPASSMTLSVVDADVPTYALRNAATHQKELLYFPTGVFSRAFFNFPLPKGYTGGPIRCRANFMNKGFGTEVADIQIAIFGQPLGAPPATISVGGAGSVLTTTQIIANILGLNKSPNFSLETPSPLVVGDAEKSMECAIERHGDDGGDTYSDIVGLINVEIQVPKESETAW